MLGQNVFHLIVFMVIASYTAYEFTVKTFKNFDTLFLASTSIRSQFQWNRKYFSALFWNYTWLMIDISVKCFPFAFAYPAIPVLTSVSVRISIKTNSQKFQSFWIKSFGDAAKYCWFHNSSINLIKNTVKGN